MVVMESLTEVFEEAYPNITLNWVVLPENELRATVTTDVATALLCMIFAWNEFFFAFNLTVTKAAPVSVYISSFKTAEGHSGQRCRLVRLRRSYQSSSQVGLRSVSLYRN